MPAIIPREHIIQSVSTQTCWMIKNRMDKLKNELQESMSVNGFLLPIQYDLHPFASFAEFSQLLLNGHLLVGHATSFGKLIDEKILPETFGTKKLSRAFRKANPPLTDSCFDEIDHLVHRPDGTDILLSLKASRWTIQLSAATSLNAAFAEIIEEHSQSYDQIVVGVFSGTQESLTDKYDILRGINRGQNHSVTGLTANVHVYAGRNFWSWLNGGAAETQDWVLDGILSGLKESNCREESETLLRNYAIAFNRRYEKYISAEGHVDWHAILTEING